MKKLLMFLFVALFVVMETQAQTAGQYGFSTATNSSLIDMSSGTTNIFATGTYRDDDASTLQTIGFTFRFCGTDYTQYSINSNGQMRLGSTVIAGGSTVAGSTIPLIIPLSGDNSLQAAGKVHFKVLGSAPDRILVIEWDKVRVNYSSSDVTGPFCTFQVLLYETSNVLNFIYGTMYNRSTSSQSRSVGISNNSSAGTVGYVASITTTPTFTSGSSYGTTSFASSSNMINLNSSTNGSRRIFTFTPPNPCLTPISQPTNFTFTNIASSSLTGTYTAANGSDSYLVVRTTTNTHDTPPVDGTAYTAGATLGNGTITYAGSALTFNATGLSTSTQYYYFVYSMNSSCTGGPKYLTISPLSETVTTGPAAPVAFTASAQSSTMINFSATGNANNDNVLIAWNSSNTFGTPTGTYSEGDPISGGGTVLFYGNAADAPKHNGLSPATTYYYRIWSQLGTLFSSSLSANATTVSIVPFFEGFENANTHNTDIKGWSQESVSGTYNWTANNSLIDYNRTPRTGSWNAYLHYSDEQWMFKGIELTENVQYTFKMYARQDMATNTDANITVKYGNQSNAASMLNTIVSSTGIINGNYQLITGSFTPLTSGVFYIGIKGYMNGTPFYISIDDISIVQSTTPTVTTELISGITTNSANSGGNVTDDGGLSVTERGVCWSTSQNPTILDNITTNGSGNGAYTSSITGLSQGTLYYVRAYATNSLGTSYGSEISFTTNSSAIEPTVITTAVINIATTTASSGGNVTSDGGSVILERGICFSLSSNPTILDAKVIDLTASTGIFASDINGLIPNSTYYVRAYATNAIGTSYGTEQNFTTDPLISSFPYNQDFEGITNEGWKTAINTGTLNEWVKGTPAKTQIAAAHGGTNAWITKLNGNYGSSVQYSLITPSFDFSALVIDPLLSFWHNLKTETGYDAGVIEYSIDNGATWTKVDATLGTGANFNTSKSTNWYNSSSTSGPIANPKWSGSSTAFTGNLNGWIQSKTVLTGLAGQTNVKLRFRFGSDTSGEDEGWAIDDFSVYMPTVASLTTSSHSFLTGNSFTSGGNITDNGGAAVTSRGVCWSVNPNPTITNDKTTDGTGIGVFVSNITGLNANTSYYYRAYATNAIGTAYGNELNVNTLSTYAPSVTTNPISSLTNTTVTLSGEITANGGDATISESGIVYSTSANPTIISGTKILTNPLVSTGIYNLDVTALTAGQTYYFKAFATNNTGTGYGNELSFTTKTTPTISTTPISNITTTTATGGGNVTSDGGDAVTARGICWATTATPTLANSFTTDANGGIGIFTSSMTSLSANGQTYYVRAYATNAYGTTYGNQVSFVTACNANTLPYAETFEGAFPWSCWTNLNWDNSKYGSAHAGLKWAYSNTTNSKLTSPAIILPVGGSYKFSYWYKVESASYPQNMDVLLSTDGTNFTTTLNQHIGTTNGIYSKIEINLNAYAGQTVYLRFVGLSGTGGYDYGICVDDVSLIASQAGLWTGATNNDWATATNWDNGIVPSAATNVTIPATATNFPTVTTSATINNLTIESNATGTGSLLDGGNLTINGTATVKQYVVGDKWHLISSPIQNATANVFHLAAGQADIYIREFNSGAWSYITDLITPIVAKKGYGIWADCITHSTPNPTISFTGVLNTGVQTLPTTGGNNWDLIGNPYTSAIDWDLIDPTNVAQSNISVAGSAVRVWNQTSNVYSAYSKLGGSINNGKRYIAPMQGFFVQSLDANGITLNDSYRVHNGQQFVKSTNSISDLMKITAQRNTYKDEINVVMNPIATNSYDFQYDATKLFVNDVNIPEIYTVSGNKNLVINIFGSAPIAIPMNIRMGVADNVTLTASEFANFDANVNITLEDMLTGTTQDLRQNPTYTFAATIGENANRFVLHFATPNGINEPNAGNISIYANNNNIYVNTTELVKEISVYNMLGQVITTISGNAKSLNTISMNNATGNYVVKVTTDKGVRTEKVFVK